MMDKTRTVLVGIAALMLVLSSTACADSSRPTFALSATHAADTPESVVDAFAAALRAGDATVVQQLMAPGVVIAESGGVERSFDEYAAEHLPADIAFTTGVEFTLEHRDTITDHDMATVISRSQVHGQFHDRPIHSNSMETMVLRRIDGHWRIVHIHWSSSPISAGAH